MSGGTPIRFRRIQTEQPVDLPRLGEPFINTLDQKFGFYDGASILWYPGLELLTNRMIMNSGQHLSGKDSNGDALIDLSFDTPNALEIIKRSDSTVLARFASDGAVFDNLSAAVQLPGGIYNRGSHPGFLPQLYSSAYKSTADAAGAWLGPNTYLWKAGGATGNIRCKYEYVAGLGALLHQSVEQFTMRVEAVDDGAVNGAGVRMWLFDPFLGYVTEGENANKVFVAIKGTAGEQCQIRVGRAGSYTTVTVTGTDNWQRKEIEIPAHLQTTSYVNGGSYEPFAVDLVHNPTGGIWHIGEPTVQCVDTIETEIFQYRSLAERMAVAAAYYWEPQGISVQGTSRENVNVPIPFPAYTLGKVDYDIDVISTDYPVSIASKTNKGFEAYTTTSNSTRWGFKPRIAYRGSLTDIS